MSHTLRRQMFFIALFLVVVIVYVTLFRQCVVRGDSMLPTYHDGQGLLVLRRHGFSSLPKRGDVVVLRKDRDTIIKRVAYLPGEIINDKSVLNPTLGNHLDDYYEQKAEGKNTILSVPAGYIVVLGDNRGISYDSRSFGPVSLKDVVGVVVNALPPPPEVSIP